jgi:hypothetical protein
MPIIASGFNEKTYNVNNADFVLRRPTLGIKRQGSALASVIILKIKELHAVKKILDELEEIDNSNADTFEQLANTVDRLNNIQKSIFVQGEEFFRKVLLPIKPDDIKKLVADEIDTDVLLVVIQDFFLFANILIPNVKK